MWVPAAYLYMVIRLVCLVDGVASRGGSVRCPGSSAWEARFRQVGDAVAVGGRRSRVACALPTTRNQNRRAVMPGATGDGGGEFVEAARLIVQAGGNVVAFTGAGISVESTRTLRDEYRPLKSSAGVDQAPVGVHCTGMMGGWILTHRDLCGPSAFTLAGGIPDFRSEGGLWTRYDPGMHSLLPHMLARCENTQPSPQPYARWKVVTT